MKIIVGGPGTGKTQRLLREIETLLSRGVSPESIALISFTRQAAYGARDRAITLFGGNEKDYPYFRTLHSIAYRSAGYSRDQVAQLSHYRAVGAATGLPFSDRWDPTTPSMFGPSGDRACGVAEFARARRIPLALAYRETRSWLSFEEIELWWRSWIKFKSEVGLVDYTDMIEEFVASNTPLPVKYAFVDEAQDLTPLQWEMVNVAFKGADLTVAGDDDQAIYRWAGADVDRFIDAKGEREVLPLSHRLTREIHATVEKIGARLLKRIPKHWVSSDRNGTVAEISNAEGIADELRDGTWLLLARTSMQLRHWENVCRESGVLYRIGHKLSADPEDVLAIRAYETARKGKAITGEHAQAVLPMLKLGRRKLDKTKLYSIKDLGGDRGIWHDAFEGMPVWRRAYLREALKRGEDLNKEPRIRIDTIHSAKGAEAQRVGVISDLTARVVEGTRDQPDDEHRVWFVAASRASERLVMVRPGTPGYVL